MSKLLSTPQVAARLGVSPSRVVQYIKKGRLPAVKVGTCWAVQASDVEQFERRPVGRPRKGEGE